MKTPVYFAPIDDDETIGLCFMRDNRRVIQIDTNWWQQASEVDHQILLLHERGHCDWNLDHVEGRMPDYCPSSIMNPVIPSEHCFLKHEQEYIEDYNLRITDESFEYWSEVYNDQSR